MKLREGTQSVVSKQLNKRGSFGNGPHPKRSNTGYSSPSFCLLPFAGRDCVPQLVRWSYRFRTGRRAARLFFPVNNSDSQPRSDRRAITLVSSGLSNRKINSRASSTGHMKSASLGVFDCQTVSIYLKPLIIIRIILRSLQIVNTREIADNS